MTLAKENRDSNERRLESMSSNPAGLNHLEALKLILNTGFDIASTY